MAPAGVRGARVWRWSFTWAWCLAPGDIGKTREVLDELVVGDCRFRQMFDDLHVYIYMLADREIQ